MRRTQELWITRGAARLYSNVCGQGPNIVGVHGGPGAGHEYMMRGLSSLSDEFRVVFYDQRNAGRSCSPKVYATLDDHIVDLNFVMEEREVTRGILVGHSWGALLALLYACRYPHRVAAVALVNAVSPQSDDRWRFAEVVSSRLESEAFARHCAEIRASTKTAAVSLGARLEFARATWALFHRVELASSLPYFKVGGLEAEQLWIEAATQFASAKVCNVPMIVLHGDHDPTPMSTANAMAARVGILTCSVCLPLCGHLAPIEAPEALSSAIRNFARTQLCQSELRTEHTYSSKPNAI